MASTQPAFGGMFRQLIELGVIEINTEPLDEAIERRLKQFWENTFCPRCGHQRMLISPSIVLLWGLSAVLHKSEPGELSIPERPISTSMIETFDVDCPGCGDTTRAITTDTKSVGIHCSCGVTARVDIDAREVGEWERR